MFNLTGLQTTLNVYISFIEKNKNSAYWNLNLGKILKHTILILQTSSRLICASHWYYDQILNKALYCPHCCSINKTILFPIVLKWKQLSNVQCALWHSGHMLNIKISVTRSHTTLSHKDKTKRQLAECCKAVIGKCYYTIYEGKKTKIYLPSSQFPITGLLWILTTQQQ